MSQTTNSTNAILSGVRIFLQVQKTSPRQREDTHSGHHSNGGASPLLTCSTSGSSTREKDATTCTLLTRKKIKQYVQQLGATLAVSAAASDIIIRHNFSSSPSSFETCNTNENSNNNNGAVVLTPFFLIDCLRHQKKMDIHAYRYRPQDDKHEKHNNNNNNNADASASTTMTKAEIKTAKQQQDTPRSQPASPQAKTKKNARTAAPKATVKRTPEERKEKRKESKTQHSHHPSETLEDVLLHTPYLQLDSGDAPTAPTTDQNDPVPHTKADEELLLCTPYLQLDAEALQDEKKEKDVKPKRKYTPRKKKEADKKEKENGWLPTQYLDPTYTAHSANHISNNMMDERNSTSSILTMKLQNSVSGVFSSPSGITPTMATTTTKRNRNPLRKDTSTSTTVLTQYLGAAPSRHTRETKEGKEAADKDEVKSKKVNDDNNNDNNNAIQVGETQLLSLLSGQNIPRAAPSRRPRAKITARKVPPPPATPEKEGHQNNNNEEEDEDEPLYHLLEASTESVHETPIYKLLLDETSNNNNSNEEDVKLPPESSASTRETKRKREEDQKDVQQDTTARKKNKTSTSTTTTVTRAAAPRTKHHTVARSEAKKEKEKKKPKRKTKKKDDGGGEEEFLGELHFSSVELLQPLARDASACRVAFLLFPPPPPAAATETTGVEAGDDNPHRTSSPREKSVQQPPLAFLQDIVQQLGATLYTIPTPSEGIKEAQQLPTHLVMEHNPDWMNNNNNNNNNQHHEEAYVMSQDTVLARLAPHQRLLLLRCKAAGVPIVTPQWVTDAVLLGALPAVCPALHAQHPYGLERCTEEAEEEEEITALVGSEEEEAEEQEKETHGHQLLRDLRVGVALQDRALRQQRYWYRLYGQPVLQGVTIYLAEGTDQKGKKKIENVEQQQKQKGQEQRQAATPVSSPPSLWCYDWFTAAALVKLLGGTISRRLESFRTADSSPHLQRDRPRGLIVDISTPITTTTATHSPTAARGKGGTENEAGENGKEATQMAMVHAEVANKEEDASDDRGEAEEREAVAHPTPRRLRVQQDGARPCMTHTQVEREMVLASGGGVPIVNVHWLLETILRRRYVPITSYTTGHHWAGDRSSSSSSTSPTPAREEAVQQQRQQQAEVDGTNHQNTKVEMVVISSSATSLTTQPYEHSYPPPPPSLVPHKKSLHPHVRGAVDEEETNGALVMVSAATSFASSPKEHGHHPTRDGERAQEGEDTSPVLTARCLPETLRALPLRDASHCQSSSTDRLEATTQASSPV